MKNKLLNISIYSILILSIIILSDLSYAEYFQSDICAKFTIFPACYFALVYLIILFIAQTSIRFDIFFLIFLGFALTLVSYAAIGHIFGTIKCTPTKVGIPACFLVLGILLFLLFLKFIQIRLQKYD
jgi:hypothetical protein